MKAFLILSEAEPALVMTGGSGLTHGSLVEGMRARGFEKFIAHEVPLERLRERYGLPLEVLEYDMRKGRSLRFLDSNGSHVFDNVRLTDLGTPIHHDCRSSA